ncbi:hypothetical protein D3C71_1514780 [compost metagenome]
MILPKYSCWLAKYFCDFFIMTTIRPKPMIVATIAVRVIITLVFSIMTIEPTNIAKAVTTLPIL